MKHSRKVINAWLFVILLLSCFDHLQAINMCVSCTDCPEEVSVIDTTIVCGSLINPINCAIFINTWHSNQFSKRRKIKEITYNFFQINMALQSVDAKVALMCILLQPRVNRPDVIRIAYPFVKSVPIQQTANQYLVANQTMNVT